MTHKKITPDDIFQCQQCGDCCTGYGGTYITPKDIEAIAAFIDAAPETFTETYCQISDGRPVLKVGDNNKCIFFDETVQCTIHPVKPRMCRAWPFIKNILKAPGNWELMSQACPGIRTGFPHSEVQACVKKEMEKLNKMREDLD